MSEKARCRSFLPEDQGCGRKTAVRRSQGVAVERLQKESGAQRRGAKEVRGWGQKVEMKTDNRTLLESRKGGERRQF